MLSSVARFVLDPFHILLFLVVVMLISVRYGAKRSVRYSAMIVVLWFFMITTPFIPYALQHSLESKYLPLQAELIQSEEELHIIVLGAGYIYNRDLPPNSQLDREMLTRLVEGIRLHRQLKNSILIVSGPYNNDMYSQAEVAKRTAISLGVAESAIRTQSDGHTTYEEALVYRRKFHKGQKVVVVTSASHMHRALGDFRRLGIEALPSPAYYRYRSEDGLKISLMPSLSHVEAMRSGLYEYSAIFRNFLRNSV